MNRSDEYNIGALGSSEFSAWRNPSTISESKSAMSPRKLRAMLPATFFKPGIINPSAAVIQGSPWSCARRTTSLQTAFFSWLLVWRFRSVIRSSSNGIGRSGRPNPMTCPPRNNGVGCAVSSLNRRSMISSEVSDRRASGIALPSLSGEFDTS